MGEQVSARQPKATVIEVRNERGVEVVAVREDRSGKIHHFVTGSINGVKDLGKRKVGAKGHIEWMIGESFNLPVFK